MIKKKHFYRERKKTMSNMKFNNIYTNTICMKKILENLSTVLLLA